MSKIQYNHFSISERYLWIKVSILKGDRGGRGLLEGGGGGLFGMGGDGLMKNGLVSNERGIIKE